jgi:hypothetical protein
MRLMGSGLFLVLCLATTAAARQEVAKDQSGKPLAVLYDCNSCKSPAKGEFCAGGVEAGFSDGKACGECLLKANFGVRIPYAADIYVTGHLKDQTGKPIVGKFIKLKLPNTWGYRTRTVADGFFRLALGATLDRSDETVRVDLGDVSMSSTETNDYFLYMVPPDYKPCEDAAK